LDGARVCFEVDGVDPEHRAGWSVLVTGTARIVRDPHGELHCARPESWARGEREVFVAIKAERITGRRVGPQVGRPGAPDYEL
jgi:nitroimidazol reductase NimA-like FMN-containing flavoprotein (pyridoxamine 5'-phosphate oxidase superfamily)